MEILPWIIFKY